jgi:hypothetical protein
MAKPPSPPRSPPRKPPREPAPVDIGSESVAGEEDPGASVEPPADPAKGDTGEGTGSPDPSRR